MCFSFRNVLFSSDNAVLRFSPINIVKGSILQAIFRRIVSLVVANLEKMDGGELPSMLRCCL